MIPPALIHRLGFLLAGAYFVAQIFGVIPLMSSHSAHAAAGSLVCYTKDGSGGQPQLGHHAGDTDDLVHHHTLQDLMGVFAALPNRVDIPLVHVTVAPRSPRPLAEAEAVRLDRPPKPDLSI
jgi:hypothetical protein